jgi:hypothetical protein
LAEDRMAMEFGWEDDGGLGELLIAQTLAGTKTATCGVKRQYSDDELRQVRVRTPRLPARSPMFASTRTSIRTSSPTMRSSAWRTRT